MVCVTAYSRVSFRATEKLLVDEQLAIDPTESTLSIVQLIVVLLPLWRTTNVLLSAAPPAWTKPWTVKDVTVQATGTYTTPEPAVTWDVPPTTGLVGVV